ncbi:FadR/GntR family transcriptional regulator [Blastococcus sp. SYSU D00820]
MTAPHEQLRQPKVSAMVADLLRKRVLDGELTDMLPGQDVLLAELGVSRPALREALGILESEGLITVRRGSQGGAFIHRPSDRHSGYMMALVLESRSVQIEDVAEALQRLESMCAGLCADRPDRLETVVPALEHSNDLAAAVLDDPIAYVDQTADFHRLLAEQCGNQSLQVTVGALEAIWLAHVQQWAESTTRAGTFPDREYREQGLAVHRRLTRLIADGAADLAVAEAAAHFDPSQFADGASTSVPVRASLLHAANVARAERRRL